MDSHRSDTVQATLSVNGAGDSARICLSGVVDPTAVGALQDVVARLRRAAPHTVVIDVAEVTFACSTRANFLVEIRSALAADAVVALARPSPIIRRSGGSRPPAWTGSPSWSAPRRRMCCDDRRDRRRCPAVGGRWADRRAGGIALPSSALPPGFFSLWVAARL